MVDLYYLTSTNQLLKEDGGDLANDCCCSRCDADGTAPCHTFERCGGDLENCGDYTDAAPRYITIDNTDYLANGSPDKIALPNGVVYQWITTGGSANTFARSTDFTGWTFDPDLDLVISGFTGNFVVLNGSFTATPYLECSWRYTYGDGTVLTIEANNETGWYAEFDDIGGASSRCWVFLELSGSGSDGCPVTGTYDIATSVSPACTVSGCSGGGWDCDDTDAGTMTVTVA